MSGFAEEFRAIEDAKLRRDFLNLYGTPGFLVVRNVLVKLGVPRSRYNAWRRDDPEFAREVACVHEDLADMIEEMALKKAGVIPTPEKEKRGLWRYSDTMVGLLLRVYRNQPENATFQSFNINVAGLSRDALMGLAAPTESAPAQATHQRLSAAESSLPGNGEDCSKLPS